LFVRITTYSTAHHPLLDNFLFTSESKAIVGINEYTYKQGAEIYGEEEPAEYVYQVKQGAVRSYKLLLDGRRQIAAFHLVGDIFGLVRGPTHKFTAEALVATTLRLVKRQSLEIVADSDAVVTGALLGITSNNLQHAENHLLLLGRKTALERVAAFLTEMDKRLTAAGVMILPMSRRDIADYLGLTIETVSRALSQMRGAGVVDFVSRRELVILDRQRLATFQL
jgi:CRP/FNR family transcriptional regulator, nitrogen fixation regulation protein